MFNHAKEEWSLFCVNAASKWSLVDTQSQTGGAIFTKDTTLSINEN